MTTQIKGATYTPQAPDEHIRGISFLLPVQDVGGFVFLVAYTKKEEADSERLLQTLAEQTRRLADSFGKEANPQHRFEQFLGALNQTLAEDVREGRWNIPIEQLHVLVGIATSQEMYLSGTGELIALFFHKKPSQRYQIFNLFRGIQTEQSLPTWEKPFAVVLDGDLHPGDVFCITDKDLQRAIPQEELNHILTSLPPISAVEKIRQYFPHKDAMLLTVLRVMEKGSSPVDQKDRSRMLASDRSVEQLSSTESTTDRLLDDQRPRVSVILKKILTFIQSRTDSRSRILQDLQKQASLKTSLLRVGRTIWKLLLLLTKRTLKQGIKGFATLQDKEKRADLRQRISLNQRQWRGTLTQTLTRARGLPRSTTYLAGGIVLAVIVLIGGIWLISSTQARSAEQAAYEEDLASIEELMERAGAAVIYKDENQARSLYLNAQTLIEGLPTNTPERQEKIQGLNQDLQAALNDIRHLVTIPNPPLLGDLETLTDGVFGNSLLLSEGTVYVAGSDGRLYQFNRTEKQFAVAATPESTSLSPLSASQEDGRIYLLTEQGAVVEGSTSESSLSPTSLTDDRWVDLEAYANRLYLLRPTRDGSEGQVVRASRSGSSFSEPSDWITSRTVPFDHAVSLAVDGSLYVLMQDGSISRFSNGSEEGWGAAVVDPRITEATKIWTDADTEYLYVLEPRTQRLVVFQKETGAFVVQYRSDAFTGVTDFVVDEQGYTMYLLAGSKLFSIAASHLE